MKLSVLFTVLMATALIAVAAPPQGQRGPVEGRGMRQGPPPWAQVDQLPADVQVLAKQIQEKMKEIQALRVQMREKMGEQNGELVTGRGPWARRGLEKAGERPQFHARGERQGRGEMMHQRGGQGPRGPMHRWQMNKKVEEAK